jgi:hypothetical protein
MADFLVIAGIVVFVFAMLGLIRGLDRAETGMYAFRIRRKLGDESGQILQSDPSVGYRLMPPGETRPVS